METDIELDFESLQMLDSEHAQLEIVHCNFTCALSCSQTCQRSCGLSSPV